MLIDLRRLFSRRALIALTLLLLIVVAAVICAAPLSRRAPRPPGAVPVFDWPARTTVILGPGL